MILCRLVSRSILMVDEYTISVYLMICECPLSIPIMYNIPQYTTHFPKDRGLIGPLMALSWIEHPTSTLPRPVRLQTNHHPLHGESPLAHVLDRFPLGLEDRHSQTSLTFLPAR